MAIGIIGTGWGARVQVPAFRSAGLEVLALAGSDAAKTGRIADEIGVRVATGDWRELLARDDITLVSIVTPPHLHGEMAIAALEAGKHVLCEKPTALSAAEARQMMETARAHPELLALMDHELRFLPALREGRRLLHEGAIGRPRHARVIFTSSNRADPQRPWTWWSDTERGGGALGAVGSHQIDTLRYLTGTEVEAVAARLWTDVAERPAEDGQLRAVTSDDGYSLLLKMNGGLRATVDATSSARSNEPLSVTIYGTEGALRWYDGRLQLAQPGQDFEDRTPAHSVALPEGLSGDFPHGTIYLGQALRRFLDGDGEALAPAATFDDGLRIQQVLDAARNANASGATERI